MSVFVKIFRGFVGSEFVKTCHKHVVICQQKWPFSEPITYITGMSQGLKIGGARNVVGIMCPPS